MKPLSPPYLTLSATPVIKNVSGWTKVWRGLLVASTLRGGSWVWLPVSMLSLLPLLAVANWLSPWMPLIVTLNCCQGTCFCPGTLRIIHFVLCVILLSCRQQTYHFYHIILIRPALVWGGNIFKKVNEWLIRTACFARKCLPSKSVLWCWYFKVVKCAGSPTVCVPDKLPFRSSFTHVITQSIMCQSSAHLSLDIMSSSAQMHKTDSMCAPQA